MSNKRKRRFGDRPEGRKLRTINPMNKIMPYIMPRRSDAQNFFTEKLEITEAEKLCREQIKKGNKNFTLLHVFLAAYVRTVAQRPAINRFVSGQKIYARNKIEVLMTIKKEMALDAPDTCVKVEFEPTDTIEDVYRKFNAAVEANKGTEDGSNGMEKLNNVLIAIPGLVLKFVVKLLMFLDYFGRLPMSIVNVSPFHGSMIITSMGSLGIKPIYHHIYDFGNLPLFLSYGAKQTGIKLDEDGNPKKYRYVELKVVTDERICDGYYYASAFKIMKKLFQNPRVLLSPPEKVIEDID